MPRYTCTCGQTYRISVDTAGKKVICRKCKTAFVIPHDLADTPPIPIAVEKQPNGTNEEKTPAANPAGSIPFPPPLRQRSKPRRSFGSDVGWAMLFFTDPPTLVAFVAIWIVLFVGLNMWFVSVVVAWWFSAFRFELIRTSAGGEDDLPTIGWSNPLDDLVLPAVYWSGSWLICLAPAGIFVLVGIGSGLTSWSATVNAVLQGLPGLLTNFRGASLGFVGLVFAGLFFWPMVVLCMALGGFTAMFRFDLIIKSVIRTFSGYALTVAFVFGATLIAQQLASTLSSLATGGATGTVGGAVRPGGVFLARVVAQGVTLYAEIVCMKVIGLYFHHHKHRFAWSWG